MHRLKAPTFGALPTDTSDRRGAGRNIHVGVRGGPTYRNDDLFFQCLMSKMAMDHLILCIATAY